MKYEAEIDSSLMAEVYLERFHASIFYADYKTAKQYLEKTMNLLAFEVVMTGKLGKRTKFQRDCTAQLCLEVYCLWKFI